MASYKTGYDLLDLQKRIATRVRYGGSQEDVEREIIRPAGVTSAQLPSLLRFTSSQLQLHRARRARAGKYHRGAGGSTLGR